MSGRATSEATQLPSVLPDRLGAIARRELDDRTITPGEAHDILDLIEAAEAFVRTTSVFQQRKASRDDFECLALALIELGVFA